MELTQGHPDSTNPFATVREVLKSAESTLPMAVGGTACVYDFPKGLGLDAYVLRVSFFKDFDALLKASSGLTPIPHLVAGMHIGQPLLTLTSDTPELQVTIHARQRGRSLNEWLTQYEHAFAGQSYPHHRAATAVMEKIHAIGMRHGTNPFIPIVDQVYRLGYTNGTADLYAPNILLDDESGTLNLVDQGGEQNKQLHSPVEARKAVNYLSRKSWYPLTMQTPSPPAFSRTGLWHAHWDHHISRMFERAKKESLAHHARDDETSQPGLAFAKVSDVKAVSLNDPPRALVTQLDSLMQHANLTPYCR